MELPDCEEKCSQSGEYREEKRSLFGSYCEEKKIWIFHKVSVYLHMGIKKKFKVEDCQFRITHTSESSTDYDILMDGQRIGRGWFDEGFIHISLNGKEVENDWLMLSQDIEDDFYDGKLEFI